MGTQSSLNSQNMCYLIHVGSYVVERSTLIAFMHLAMCFVIQVLVPLAQNTFRSHAAAARRKKWCDVLIQTAAFSVIQNVLNL